MLMFMLCFEMQLKRFRVHYGKPFKELYKPQMSPLVTRSLLYM